MTGILEKVSYCESEEKLVIESSQDVGPYLKRNKELYNAGDGYTPSRDMQLVASIPPIVCHHWMKQGINILRQEDWPKIAQMLDSTDYLLLRTAPGRLGGAPVRSYFGATTGR